jgi:hypothetical protein
MLAVLTVSMRRYLALPESWVTPTVVKSPWGAIAIPEPVIRSSRNRLEGVVDLTFDALPDLGGAHGRIFH